MLLKHQSLENGISTSGRAGLGRQGGEPGVVVGDPLTKGGLGDPHRCARILGTLPTGRMAPENGPYVDHRLGSYGFGTIEHRTRLEQRQPPKRSIPRRGRVRMRVVTAASLVHAITPSDERGDVRYLLVGSDRLADIDDH